MSKKEEKSKEKQNAKMLNLTNNKGITLIALIITIIVLLILAGVTINLTLGENGIFRTAEMAGKNYTQAQAQELAGLAGFENEIDNIIGGSSTNNPPTNYATLESKARPGDYVKYTPTEKQFSMTPEQTGQDANQDFNTGDYTGLWQVLYNDAEHGLQIISADTVGKLTLGHEDSDGDETIRTAEDEEKVIRAYNNSINTLNSFSRNYVDTRYAISGRSVGSDPVNPDDTVTELETIEFTPNGYTDGNVGAYVSNEKYELDNNAMKAATSQNTDGILEIGKGYWLASRFIFSNSFYGGLLVRHCYSVGDSINSPMWYVDASGVSNPYTASFGVRPVITLKSEIQTSNGDGSEGSPYELVAM